MDQATQYEDSQATQYEDSPKTHKTLPNNSTIYEYDEYEYETSNSSHPDISKPLELNSSRTDIPKSLEPSIIGDIFTSNSSLLSPHFKYFNGDEKDDDDDDDDDDESDNHYNQIRIRKAISEYISAFDENKQKPLPPVTKKPSLFKSPKDVIDLTRDNNIPLSCKKPFISPPSPPPPNFIPNKRKHKPPTNLVVNKMSSML